MNDRELLDQYVNSGSQPAFAEIARRYANLVYRCARRQTSGDEIAQDVTQAVFILLAQKARTLGREVVLAGWLVKVARYAAKDAMVSESRRRRREREASEMKQSARADRADAAAEFEGIQPVLDEGLSRLKELDRGLVAMRFLEGMELSDAAALARLTPEAARKRIDRAVAKLREFFRRRGYAVTPAALSHGASEPSAPPELAAALPVAALAADHTSRGAAIAQGASKLMQWARLKAVAALVAAVVGGVIVTAAAGGTVARLASRPATKSATTSPSTRPAPSDRRTGKFTLTFTEPSPYSALEAMGGRSATASFGTYGRKGRAYDLAQDTFQVYVPPLYRPQRQFGLFVWISAGDAVMPPQWQTVFDRNRLIYISADNTGNGREMISRMGLQLDAVHNMAQRYNIDPQRIYVAGFSGGAMATSFLYRGYPDVFSGAFCMGGGSFWIHLNDEELSYATCDWIGTDMAIDQARKVMRIVLLYGTKEGYGTDMAADYESFRLDDFAHVSQLRMEGMGHQMPSAELLDKGIAALDAGVVKNAEPVVFQPVTLSRELTYRTVKRPLPAHDPELQAMRLLNSARGYFANGRFEGVKIAAGRVLAEYAQTPSAKEAKLLLDQVEAIGKVDVPRGSAMGPAQGALFFARTALALTHYDAARLYLERAVRLSANPPLTKEAQAWLGWLDAHADSRGKPSKPAVLAVILFQSGRQYEDANLPDAAREAYERTVKDYPNTPGAAEATKWLARRL